ncbi:MAG: hypothetical protein AAF614_01720 [Chloroflexota bacterium]
MNNSRLMWMAAFCLLLLLALLLPRAQRIGATNEPILAIPSDISGESGQLVQVPVVFTNGGQAVVSTAFSIDFDESCLALDAGDENGDGVPDGMQFHTPPAFQTLASFDASDTDGELDITIVDFSPPFATLDDQTLLTLEFDIICDPGLGEMRNAAVGFSTLPRPSFGDPNGQDVPGSSQNGMVIVMGSATPTPTPSPTLTATPTPTPSPTMTATPTATPTPTVTPTPRPLSFKAYLSMIFN